MNAILHLADGVRLSMLALQAVLVPVVSDRFATVVLAHFRSMRLILAVLRRILGFLLVVLKDWLGRGI